MNRARLLIVPFLIVLFGLAGCGGVSTGQGVQTQQQTQVSPPNPPAQTGPTGEEVVIQRAREAVRALQERNMTAFAGYVHPDKGVRFSPYATVQVGPEKDQVLTAAAVRTGVSDAHKRIWGRDDAIGDPIEMTFSEYINRYVYDVDFAKAPQVSYNKQVGQSTNKSNIAGVYPGDVFVEFHFPGVDPKNGGVDWRSLRLVFERKGDTWFIVGVIHDQFSV